MGAGALDEQREGSLVSRWVVETARLDWTGIAMPAAVGRRRRVSSGGGAGDVRGRPRGEPRRVGSC